MGCQIVDNILGDVFSFVAKAAHFENKITAHHIWYRILVRLGIHNSWVQGPISFIVRVYRCLSIYTFCKLVLFPFSFVYFGL